MKKWGIKEGAVGGTTPKGGLSGSGGGQDQGLQMHTGRGGIVIDIDAITTRGRGRDRNVETRLGFDGGRRAVARDPDRGRGGKNAAGASAGVGTMTLAPDRVHHRGYRDRGQGLQMAEASDGMMIFTNPDETREAMIDAGRLKGQRGNFGKLPR